METHKDTKTKTHKDQIFRPKYKDGKIETHSGQKRLAMQSCMGVLDQGISGREDEGLPIL